MRRGRRTGRALGALTAFSVAFLGCAPATIAPSTRTNEHVLAAGPGPALDRDEAVAPTSAALNEAPARGTIGPEAVRDRAAALDPLGRALERKSIDWRRRLLEREGDDPLALARIDALGAAARLARNEAAAEALTDFYRLWQAKGSFDLSERAKAAIDRDLPKVEGLVDKGLVSPDQRDQLADQGALFDAQRLEAQLAVLQFNDRLARRIGLPDGPQAPDLLPNFDPDDARAEVDVERAVAQGLATRPEGPPLDRLIVALDDRTAPAGLRALASVNPLLGEEVNAPSPLVLLVPCLRVEDPVAIAATREQLVMLRNRQVRETVGAVRGAGLQVNVLNRQVVIAARRAQTARDVLKRERDRADQGLGGFQEVLDAELALIAAEAEVVKRMAEFRAAQVQLGRAQGRLDRP